MNTAIENMGNTGSIENTENTENMEIVDYKKRLLEIVTMRESGHSLRNIGAKYGISYERVRQLISNYNCSVPDHKRVASAVPLLKRPSIIEKYKVITDTMLREGKSINDVRQVLGVSGSTISRVLSLLRKENPTAEYFGQRGTLSNAEIEMIWTLHKSGAKAKTIAKFMDITVCMVYWVYRKVKRQSAMMITE